MELRGRRQALADLLELSLLVLLETHKILSYGPKARFWTEDACFERMEKRQPQLQCLMFNVLNIGHKRLP